MRDQCQNVERPASAAAQLGQQQAHAITPLGYTVRAPAWVTTIPSDSTELSAGRSVGASAASWSCRPRRPSLAGSAGGAGGAGGAIRACWASWPGWAGWTGRTCRPSPSAEICQGVPASDAVPYLPLSGVGLMPLFSGRQQRVGRTPLRCSAAAKLNARNHGLPPSKFEPNCVSGLPPSITISSGSSSPRPLIQATSKHTRKYDVGVARDSPRQSVI